MKTFIVVYLILVALQRPCLAQPASEQGSNCQLTVGGARPETFEDCSTLTTLDPLVPYTFYYTLTPSSTGSGTTWRGGLKIKVDAAVGGAWGGFGFGQRMLGTDAVILRKCDTCPSKARIDGYKLTDYDPATKTPGSFPIRDAAAAVAPDGSLVGTFTVDLSQSVEELTSNPFKHLSAVGPVAADGSLRPHVGAGYPYDVLTYTLKSTSSSTTGTNNTNGDTNSSADPATPTASQNPPTSTPSTSTTSSPTQLPTCSVTSGSVLADFSRCTTLGSNVLTVHWNAPSSSGSSASPSTGGNVTLQFALTGNISDNEWLALGFPATAGQMIGSTAAVLISCVPGSSSKICSPESIQIGAVVKDYYLGDKISRAVTSPGRLAFSNTKAETDGSGHAQGRFTVSLPLTAISNGQLNVLYAKGRCDPATGLLQHHDTRAAAALDLASGSAKVTTNTSAENKKNAHAWLMVVGWTIILSGAVIARSFKSLGPVWFQIHRALQMLGLICVLIAFILIFSALGGKRTRFTIHFNLGVAATTLGLAQLSALVFRPHLDSRYRRAWALGHHWIGRSAVILAVANIFYGIINVKNVGSWAVISYSIVFGLILGVGILKESIDYLRLPPPALMRTQFANLDQEREAVTAVKKLREPTAVAAPQQQQGSDKSGTGSGSRSGSDVEQQRS